MSKETTADRLQYIMREQNLKQIDILNKAIPFCEKYKIKLGKSDLSQFINGKVEPGQWKLTILGLALNVSEAWLMGYDVSMNRTSSDPMMNVEQDQRLNEIIKAYDSMNSEGRDKLYEQARDYSSLPRYQKETQLGLDREIA